MYSLNKLPVVQFNIKRTGKTDNHLMERVMCVSASLITSIYIIYVKNPFYFERNVLTTLNGS